MSDAVIIQLIITTGTIILAWLGKKKLDQIGADAQEARIQVKNSHGTNFRDDLDHNTNETKKVAKALTKHVKDERRRNRLQDATMTQVIERLNKVDELHAMYVSKES